MLSAGPIRTEPEPDPDDDAECQGHEHDARDDARAAPQPAGEADRSGRPGHRANGHGLPPTVPAADLDVGPDRHGQCPEPGSQPRPRARDLDVVDGPDLVVLDGGHHVPARSGGDGRRRRRVERVDTEDDHLRIALDQLLEGDRVGVGVAGRDRVGAGERHHLGQERRVGRREDLAGRVGIADLVEDARLGAGLGGLGRGGVGRELHVGAHAVGDLGRLVGLADGGPQELDVLEHAVDRRRVDDEDRDASERNLVIASAGVKPSPPATTRSAPASTTFSVSTEEKVATSGRADGLRGEVGAVVGRHDPVAGTEVEQDLGGRRGERDDLLGCGRERDGRAFVIGERDGIGRCRRWARAGSGRREPGSRWRRLRSETSRATRRRSTRRGPGRGPREAPPAGGVALRELPRRTTGTRRTSRGIGSGGVATNRRTPRFDTDRRRG